MKKLSCLLALIWIVFNASAQLSKEGKVSLSDGSVLRYLTVQDKLNGLYVIQKDDADLARGNYVDGKRAGNWYFFSYNKELALRYNYDSKKVLFVDNKLLSAASVTVKADDSDVKSKASIPLPILSLQQYYYLATAAAKQVVPPDELNMIYNKPVIITARIDKNGMATYNVRYTLNGKAPQTRTFVIEKGAFYLQWIPASYDGIDYEAEFAFHTILSIDTDNSSGHKRFSWM